MINLFKYKKNRGFTLIEVIVATSIITVSMLALLQTSERGLTLSNSALRKSQASFLLQEGVEAVKSIRDNSWVDIESLDLDTPYYLFYNTTTKNWILDNTTTTNLLGHIPTYPIDEIFTRTVTISSVMRDEVYDIVETGGTIDISARKILVNTTWYSQGNTNSKDLIFYIFDIFN